MAVSKEMKKVKKIVNTVPEDRQAIAQSIYNELVFMQGTLDKLKEQIIQDGPTSTYAQGGQTFVREHPALKSYNTTVQKYSLLYKQLISILPESIQEVVKDELLDFIKR